MLGNISEAGHYLKHAPALRKSDQSLRKIFQVDLNFHPYKIIVLQEL